MISKILALEALIGTIRAHLSVPVRNVSDISPEQHSHEIINAIELLSDKDKQLAEARAEIEHLRQELRDCSTMAARQIVPAEIAVDELRAEIERKDALIEQMREALLDVKMNAAGGYKSYLISVDAALSAAERGGK